MSAGPSPHLLTRRGCVLGLTLTAVTRAMGRTPRGGELRLELPWALGQLDPHGIDDAAAAFFGHAVVEPPFALDRRGAPYPTLAAALPQRTGRGVAVTLRAGLHSGRGRPLDARDLIWSLARSRLGAGKAVLSDLAAPTPIDGQPLSVLFESDDPDLVARRLSSPVTPLLPRGFRPRHPDGTGPFVATLSRDQLVLRRNVAAARGPSNLSRIVVHRAHSLASALRAFEAGDADLGWLGTGLHRKRSDAVSFDAGAVGWIVLLTGTELGRWGAPGIAQQLIDGVGTERLAPLGLTPLPSTPRAQGAPHWRGPRAELIVDTDSPHLLEIARVVAGAASGDGHPISVAALPRAQVERRRKERRFQMMLRLVRRVERGERGALLSVLSAAEPSLASHPPHLGRAGLGELTRTLRLGVVGELRMAGAHAGDLHALQGWQLGDAWRTPGAPARR